MVRENNVFCGDKYVMTVEAVWWSPTDGNRVLIKEIPNLVLRDADIDKLEKYKDPKEVLHTCENCKHRHYEREMPPCSICDNNYDIETRDMFEPKNGK